MGNTENVSNTDDMCNRLMSRMKMRKRKTKESNGKKETHEVN